MTAAARIPSAPLPPVVAARSDAVARTVPPAPTAGRDQTLFHVGERRITKADLGDFVMRYFPERAADALTQLVDAALIRHEAAREGVQADPERVRVQTAAYLDERRRQVRIQYGRDTDLETQVRERYGREFEDYVADAERLAELALLRDRLVRLDQLREDGVEVRVLVFADRESAAVAVERLREGADMTRLARRAGVRPPAAPPPFARSEIRPPDLAGRLFAAGDGGVLEPESFEGELEGRPHTWWQVFKVVRAWRGTNSPWTDLRSRIENELESGPGVTLEEYLRWRRRTGERLAVHPADPGGR